MNKALVKLLFMRFRGGIRHRLRQLVSPAGAIFGLIIVVFIWSLLSASSNAQELQLRLFTPHDPEQARAAIGDYMALGLFAAWLFNVFGAVGAAFQYSQTEINFLFAGPFSRRDLVVYKCITFLTGMFLTAVLIVVLAPSKTLWLPATFAGALLAPMFLQLSGAFVRMAGRTYNVAWFERIRRPAFLALFLVPPALLVLTLGTNIGILDVLEYFRDSAVGRVLLAPFNIFAGIFLARQFFPDLIGYGVLAIVTNVVLVGAVVYMDRQWSDDYSFETERMARRWSRLKRGGSFLASDRITARSWQKPAFLGGAGPIVWRQWINATRNSGKVVIVMLLIAMLAGPLIANARDLHQTSSALGLVYLVVAFIMPRSLLWDFRGDWDSLELYRALPVSPSRVCIGQLAVPVLVASAVQSVMIASTMLFFESAARAAQSALFLYLIPANLLLYGLENFVFLMFPTRILPVGRVDFEFMGRTLLEFSLKTVALLAMAGIAALAGFKALDLSGQSYFWLIVASWSVLALMSVAMIPLNAMAFRRFRIDQEIAP